MRKVPWLLVLICILSACTFSGQDLISFFKITPTPTPTQPPTPSLTPTPEPTPTPIPYLFERGQEVYLLPELKETVFGPFKLGRAIHFMQVSDLQCGDYQTYQESETWVYHGQTGTVEETLTCGESNYYQLALETWTHSDVEDMWVTEEQLAGDYPVLDYPFILSFPDDSLEVAVLSPYTAYLPPQLVLEKGQEGLTAIDGEPVQIQLDQVVEVDHNKSKFYRYLATGFTIRNQGDQGVEISSKDLIQGRANALDVISNPTVKLTQINPLELSIPPGESLEVELVWKFTRTRYSDHDLAVYLAINTTLEDNLFLIIHRNTVFFRDVLTLSN